MFNSAGYHTGSPQNAHLVAGATFDGSPYQIVLKDAAVFHGSSARIMRGNMLGVAPLVVAVKVFPELFDPVTEALLSRELSFAREVSLRHPRVLPFIGTANVGGRTAIVSVYMENGNLTQYLRKFACEYDKKKLILQVAEGVEFLHGTARVVHGDLKCANVLISDSGEALLADFGLSTFAEKSQSATATMTAIRQMNTIQFAAPELLLGEDTTTLSKTCQSDVYAFGMLILEVISQQPPWGTKSALSVMQAVCSGAHPPRPTLDGTFVSISHTWWNICLWCWSFDPRERPTIKAVLEGLKLTEHVPGREVHFNHSLTAAIYTPDGKTIVGGCDYGLVMLFDIATGSTRLLGSRRVNCYVRVAVSPDGQRIAASTLSILRVWDIRSGVLVLSMDHGHHVSCVAYSPDGTRIASGGADGTLQLWNVATGGAFGHRLEGHTLQVTDISFSPDGIYIASASHDGHLRLWDSVTGALRSTLQLPDTVDYASSISFSPDGRRLVAGYDGGKVIVWDVHGMDALHVLDRHDSTVWCVAFSPSGEYIASGAGGGDIRIWKAHERKENVGPRLAVHKNGVRSVAFSPDGRTLLSVSDDGTVRAWDLYE